MKIPFKFLVLSFAASFLIFGTMSCSKVLQDNRDNITSAEDYSSAESELAGVFDVSDDLNETNQNSLIAPQGAIIKKIDSTGNPIIYEIDFGPLGTTAPQGTLCKDGKYRAGKLRISVTLPYTQVGAVAIVTAGSTNPYYSGDGTNMFKIEAEVRIKRTATSTFEITTTNGKLTDTDGDEITFSGIKTIEKIKGLASQGIWGDEYQITGSGSGINRKGEAYTWNINTPLIKRLELGCAKTFVKGIIELKNTDASTSLKIDFDPYNNEACDRTAKAIFGNRGVIFTIR